MFLKDILSFVFCGSLPSIHALSHLGVALPCRQAVELGGLQKSLAALHSLPQLSLLQPHINKQLNDFKS